jgi:hypothetical protein
VPGTITTRRAWPRRQVVLFALILLAGAVGACSTASPPPATQSAGASAPGSPAVQPDFASFCDAAIDLVQVFEGGPGISSTATPEDVATGLQEFQARFEPPLTTVEKNMPDVVRQDVGTLGRQARYAVAAKTTAPLDTPEFDSALTRTRINLVSQCGLREARITSTDYKYEGIPPNVAAGALAVTFINLGAEPHEMEVFRINNDPRPFKELIGLPQAERDTVLTSTESNISASPGSTATELLKLAPGRYGVACLVPQGSTAAQDGTGPPHAALGEDAEFTVQ